MTTNGWSELAGELSSLLRLSAPPIGITFSDERPDGVDADSTVATYAAEDKRRFV